MALLQITSPHTHINRSTGDIMKLVILATLPGLIALTYFFGWGNVINIMWACAVAVGCEAAITKLRKRSISFYLKDYSAVVTAVLLGLALPPYAPWWLTMVAVGAAIILGKQLYGGLGFNPFNPAMLGYVVVLISFPLEMSTWSSPLAKTPNLVESISLIFPLFTSVPIDAITAATPLDLMKQNNSLTSAEIYLSEPVFLQGLFVGKGYEWVNVGFLVGGLLLLQQRIYTWHAPISFLITIAVCSIAFYDGGSSTSQGSPLFHLFSGGTMLGAFFIITDPVTSPTTHRGKLYFGVFAGLLVFIIRSWGNFPDAVAFSVLLLNLSSPLIEYYTIPRTYGHKKAKRATDKKEQ